MTNFQTRVVLMAFAGMAIFCVLLGAGQIHFGPPPLESPFVGTATGSAQHNSTVREAERVLADWNAAEARHDVAAIEALYADRVRFYHRELTPTECGELLRRFYKEHPSFIQHVDAVSVFHLDGSSSTCVAFDKTYPTDDATNTVRAYLILDANLRIEEESDDRTDKNLDPNGAGGSHPCTQTP